MDRTEKSITLSWKCKEKNVTKFLIYRAVKDESLSLYTSVSGSNYTMKDVNLRMGSDYKFGIKAVFKMEMSLFFQTR